MKRLLIFTFVVVLFFAEDNFAQPGSSNSNAPGSSSSGELATNPGPHGLRNHRGSSQSKVTVLAPESLRLPSDFLIDVFKHKNETDIEIKYGPISVSESGIIGGSTAEIVFSNDPEILALLNEKGLISEKHILFSDSLVLAVPKKNRAAVKSPTDLSLPAVKRILIPEDSTPEGLRAHEALRALKLEEILGPKLTVCAPTAQCLKDLADQKGEAGIFFLRNTKSNRGLQTIYSFSRETYSPQAYPAILLTSAKRNIMAEQFYAFLNSDYADKVFRSFGFDSRYAEEMRLTKEHQEAGVVTSRTEARREKSEAPQ